MLPEVLSWDRQLVKEALKKLLLPPFRNEGSQMVCYMNQDTK